MGVVPGEEGEISPQHEGRLHQAPEGEHGPVLCVSHPAFPCTNIHTLEVCLISTHE